MTALGLGRVATQRRANCEGHSFEGRFWKCEEHKHKFFIISLGSTRDRSKRNFGSSRLAARARFAGRAYTVVDHVAAATSVAILFRSVGNGRAFRQTSAISAP